MFKNALPLRRWLPGAIALPGLLIVLGAVSSDPQGSQELSLPADLHQYDHINTLVVPSADSPIHGIHHFYMSENGRDLFLDGGTDQYPDGTVFVGKVYQPVETEEGRYREGALAAYTLMMKDSGSEATGETGGWHFAMFGPDGTNRGVDPVEGCFGCHQPSSDTDFVLSKPLG